MRSADRASDRPHGPDGSTARASSLTEKLHLNLPTARRRRPLPSSAEPCCDLKPGVGTFSTRQRFERVVRIEPSQPQRTPKAPCGCRPAAAPQLEVACRSSGARSKGQTSTLNGSVPMDRECTVIAAGAKDDLACHRLEP